MIIRIDAGILTADNADGTDGHAEGGKEGEFSYFLSALSAVEFFPPAVDPESQTTKLKSGDEYP
jgi:hypothetical protein